MYVVAGASVGFIVGITGVGGGSLMTPLLVLLFGFKPSVAVGTDLLYAALTKCAGVSVHARHGSVKWRIVGHLAAGSLPGAILAIQLLEHLKSEGIDINSLITSTLGVMLILTSLVLFTKGRWQRWVTDPRLHGVRTRWRKWRDPATVFAGFVLGVLVTLSSIGAGALGAAILCLLYPRLPALSVVGTDLAHAIPLALVAGLGHWHLGTVDFQLLGALLLGSIPGIWVGSHVGMRLPEPVLRPILAGMLLLIGLHFAY